MQADKTSDLGKMATPSWPCCFITLRCACPHSHNLSATSTLCLYCPVRSRKMVNTMKNLYTLRDEFKDELYRLRLDAELTVKELSEKASMSQSLVSAYELGDKAVSSESADKLADTFHLKGKDREDFFLLAANTRRRDCLVPYARTLSGELLNFVPRTLRLQGIDVGTISNCQYERDATGEEQLVIELRDGRKAVCSLSVALN